MSLASDTPTFKDIIANRPLIELLIKSDEKPAFWQNGVMMRKALASLDKDLDLSGEIKATQRQAWARTESDKIHAV